MKFNGKKLTEFNATETVVFNPPKKMVVWDNEADGCCTEEVVAVIPSRPSAFRVIGAWGAYAHCAELPPSTLATHKELAKWLAGCNGELRFAMTSPECYTYLGYTIHEADRPVPLEYAVRKWGSVEWRTATREYLGLED